jgi:hypothetical protein
MEVTVLSPSFDWKLKIKFFTHFYSINVKIDLESGKEPQTSRVLYIGPSKRLNDYYTLMA